MDGLHPEKKVKRIIWKSSTRERFANEATDESDSSSRIAQDDARKRRCSNPSQHSALPNSDDSDAPKNDDTPMKFQHDLQNQPSCDAQHSALPNSDDSDAPKNDDAPMNFQHDLQNHPCCDPQEMSTCPTNNTVYVPCMMPLLPIPSLQECSSALPIVLNGTANRGGAGPPVGAVDIGDSKYAYYFRVALPGVKKDPGEFSCEVERDGKVHVRGVTTTGARTVSRYSRVYKMKFQQQCPPGPFTLSFTLPGPVDPRLFSPNFRCDGIFEGVIVKNE